MGEKQNIRYLGFENAADGRRFAFKITAPGQEAIRIWMEIPAAMFSGEGRISFQESAKICYEKIRSVLESGRNLSAQEPIRLTREDIVQFRRVPRGQSRQAPRPS